MKRYICYLLIPVIIFWALLLPVTVGWRATPALRHLTLAHTGCVIETEEVVKVLQLASARPGSECDRPGFRVGNVTVCNEESTRTKTTRGRLALLRSIAAFNLAFGLRPWVKHMLLQLLHPGFWVSWLSDSGLQPQAAGRCPRQLLHLSSDSTTLCPPQPSRKMFGLGSDISFVPIKNVHCEILKVASSFSLYALSLLVSPSFSLLWSSLFLCYTVILPCCLSLALSPSLLSCRQHVSLIVLRVQEGN